MNKIIPSRHPALWWAISTMFLLSSCASSPPTTYYSLIDSRELHPGRESLQQNTLTVIVGPVTIADVLNRTQIVTGGANGGYTKNGANRWAGNLDHEIARALAEQLSVELHTERVIIFPDNVSLQPDCQVQVDVIAMDGTLAKEAVFTVRWILIDPHGRKKPFIQRSHINRQPKGDGYNAWVKAQRDNVKELGRVIAAAITREYL